MKRFTALAFALCLLPLIAVAQDGATLPRLTNKEIIELTRAGISADVIVAKIKVSRCNFDTDPTVLTELKQRGVTNDVLKAMVTAPYGPPQVEPTATPEPVKPTPTPPPRTPPVFTRETPGASSIPEYGDLSEIGGRRNVFVHTEDLAARKVIVKELAKYPGLSVVGRVDDAEMAIVYAAKSSPLGISRGIFGGLSYNTAHIGELALIVRADGEDGSIRGRILWTTRKAQSFSGGLTFNRHPATNATRELIKAVKRERGER